MPAGFVSTVGVMGIDVALRATDVRDGDEHAVDGDDRAGGQRERGPGGQLEPIDLAVHRLGEGADEHRRRRLAVDDRGQLLGVAGQVVPGLGDRHRTTGQGDGHGHRRPGRPGIDRDHEVVVRGVGRAGEERHHTGGRRDGPHGSTRERVVVGDQELVVGVPYVQGEAAERAVEEHRGVAGRHEPQRAAAHREPGSVDVEQRHRQHDVGVDGTLDVGQGCLDRSEACLVLLEVGVSGVEVGLQARLGGLERRLVGDDLGLGRIDQLLTQPSLDIAAAILEVVEVLFVGQQGDDRRVEAGELTAERHGCGRAGQEAVELVDRRRQVVDH